MSKKNPLQTKQLKENINSLEGEMNSLNDHLSLNPEELFPDDDLLPQINDIEIFDYEKEINEIKKDCELTLECLSSLYLNADEIDKKNINNIIKNDSLALAELKFSLSCSKRGLINLMKQLDMGINDPLMYQSVGIFQKEIRDSIKMLYDIQKKMKDFYKDIKEELKDINTGDKEIEEESIEESDDESYQIVNIDKLNDDIDNYMNKSDEKTDKK